MASFDVLKGIVIGIVLIAAGVMMNDPSIGIPLLESVGMIFLIGGLLVVGISIFSVIKR